MLYILLYCTIYAYIIYYIFEPCSTCTLNDLVPCSIGIESYMTFKARFVQRNIVILILIKVVAEIFSLQKCY